MERLWKDLEVFATNSDFIIPISLKHDVVDLWYELCYLGLKYQRFTPSGCKDMGSENLSSLQKLNS